MKQSMYLFQVFYSNEGGGNVENAGNVGGEVVEGEVAVVAPQSVVVRRRCCTVTTLTSQLSLFIQGPSHTSYSRVLVTSY